MKLNDEHLHILLIVFVIGFIFCCLSNIVRAEHELDGADRFSTNATVYACKPDGTECGWYAAKVIFLHCTEQVYIDPLTLVRSIHIYCREPRYIVPEDFA